MFFGCNLAQDTDLISLFIVQMRDENTETVNEEEDLNLERLKEKIKIQPESLINAHEGITNSGKPLRT